MGFKWVKCKYSFFFYFVSAKSKLKIIFLFTFKTSMHTFAKQHDEQKANLFEERVTLESKCLMNICISFIYKKYSC
jgi:hypothetical protein